MKNVKIRWWIKAIFICVVVVLWAPIVLFVSTVVFLTWVDSHLSPMTEMQGKPAIEFRKTFGGPLSVSHIAGFEVWHYYPWPKYGPFQEVNV